MQLPEKEYYTFTDLTYKWRIEQEYLDSLVLKEKLIPSYFVTDHQATEVRFIESMIGDKTILVEDTIHVGKHIGRRFIYLRDPVRTSLSTYDFVYGCEHPTDPKEEMAYWNWYKFTTPIKSGDSQVVFLKSEVDRYEREHRQPEKIEQPTNVLMDDLEGKAKNTALRLIGGFAMDGYGIDIHASRLTGISELVSALSEKGISITEETLSKWLKKAAKVIDKPQ